MQKIALKNVAAGGANNEQPRLSNFVINVKKIQKMKKQLNLNT